MPDGGWVGRKFGSQSRREGGRGRNVRRLGMEGRGDG